MKHAVFNPANGDEILVQRDPNGGGWANSQFYRLNLSTGTFQLVREGAFTYSPAWGPSGWIAFTQASAPNWNIWKVKSNGDSLTQLTFTGNCFRPIWNPDGTEIGYSTGNLSQAPLNSLSIRIAADGSAIDTLWDCMAFMNSTEWALPNMTVNSGGIALGTCTFESDCEWHIAHALEQTLIDTSGLIQGSTYIPGMNAVLWSHRTGLYRTDLATGATQRLVETCNSSYFTDLDYSLHTGKLLAVRWRASTPDGVILNMENDVLLMNPDGSCPQVIQIPWPQ